ncbi:hypothetical protein JW851_00725, partial [Candidatus Woesearchaeota archaeon]|nr:hypothetical protein [Candidatus Woesearchaeota archaeon]
MVNKKHSREVALVRAILLLAVVFATIAFIRDVNLTGLVASENISNELPVWTGNNTWEINKNSNLIVDLNDYFSDPNNDTLTYLATTADKISIAIEDNMLTITPAPDFAGERTISIIASDEFETITVNVKIIIGSEEERALSPVNESDITQISNASEENIFEELNITEEINISEEINITEVNISEELDTNVSSEPLETDSNISIKKFSVDEEIKDENEKYVGKKIEDEEIFETFFTKLEKNESGLLVAFYHNSSTEQPIWIEESINYTLSKTTALPLEEITLIVPKIKGIIPK